MIRFLASMPVSSLSPAVSDDTVAPQIRITSLNKPSPRLLFPEMRRLQNCLTCADAHEPFQSSILHPESPCNLPHASNLPTVSMSYRNFLAGTFSPFPFSRMFTALERDHKPHINPIDLPLDGDISPVSPASKDAPTNTTKDSDCPLDLFFASGSRVVRLFSLTHFVSTFLTAAFVQHNTCKLPIPTSLWELRPDYSGPRHAQRSVWAVYKSHDEACTALSLSSPLMFVVPALENELEPFDKLRRVDLLSPSVSPLPPSPPNQVLRMTDSVSDLRGMARSGFESDTHNRADYTISSNPPNPRTSFRLGDWICSSPTCAAHNFGRNVVCIGCSYPRSNDGPPSPHNRNIMRSLNSPRFATLSSGLPSEVSFTYPTPSSHQPIAPQFLQAPKLPTLQHPPLTPSGRAFSTGGRVQNISSDPLNPCVMYWPDNEPLPEQGQIRPSGIMGVHQPPILNTGNRGPIEHQPGDWICLKCNYLNWRRRKVCQTCYPYAEGNGDSISAAVQAERIALLTSVLAQNRVLPAKISPSPTSSDSCDTQSQSISPPGSQRSYVEVFSNKPRGPFNASQPNFDLATQFVNSQPIYQTSGYRQPSPSLPSFANHVLAPAPLLPSFLQDIIQSPTLSPVSSSSPDLSLDGCDDKLSSGSRSSTGPLPSAKDSLSHLPSSNIWRLDGEETKTLSALASSHRPDPIQKGNTEIFGLPTINIA